MAGYWESCIWHQVYGRRWEDVVASRGRGVALAWIVRRALGVDDAPPRAMVVARQAVRRLRAAGMVSVGGHPGDLVAGVAGRWCKVGRIGELDDLGQSGIRWQGVYGLVRDVAAGRGEGLETWRPPLAAVGAGPGATPVEVVVAAVRHESGLVDVERPVVAVLEQLAADGLLTMYRAGRVLGGDGGGLVAVSPVPREARVKAIDAYMEARVRETQTTK